jgi:uncharacterized protein
MRIIRSSEYRHRPWKNGGGTTREIVSFPEGAGYNSFEWLISAARVASDGPFSVFSGVDRSMAILSGEGMRLSGLGAPVVLGRASAPYVFSGDHPVTATLTGDPVVEDFNVMTRRARFSHVLARGCTRDPIVIFPMAGRTEIVFVEQGELVGISGASESFELRAQDTLIACGETTCKLQPKGEVVYLMARIQDS